MFLFQFIVNHAAFPQFLDLFVKTCLKLLLDGSPCFIAEYNVQVRFSTDRLKNMWTWLGGLKLTNMGTLSAITM